MSESATTPRIWSQPQAWLWVAPELASSRDWQVWLADGERELEKLATEANRVLGEGRGAARALTLGEQMHGVWRINRHGGMLGGMQGDRYASPDRLQQEVELAQSLRQDDVCTPRVLLALAVKDGNKWRQHLVTEEVREAQTVFDARENPAALAAAGVLLDQVFQLGLWATDLHPGNMLWRASDQSCWLIDLAGAKRLPQALDRNQRAARIDRFFRFYRKHAGEEPQGADALRDSLR